MTVSELPSGWTFLKPPSGLFSLSHPADWIVTPTEDGYVVTAPDDESGMLVVVTHQEEGLPLEFLEHWPFAAFPDAEPLSDTKPVCCNNWHGLSVRLSVIGSRSQQRRHYWIYGASSGSLYVMVMAGESPSGFTARERLYRRALNSLRLLPDTLPSIEPHDDLTCPYAQYRLAPRTLPVGILTRVMNRVRLWVLQRRYPTRRTVVLAAHPDHNAMVLVDCVLCGGLGQELLFKHGVTAFVSCRLCGGSGAGPTIAPFFTNQAPQADVALGGDGWLTCSSCGIRFSPRDRNAFTGLRHIKCGQRLRVRPATA